MSLLIELMEMITDAMIGVDQVSRNAASSRNTDIGPFIERFEEHIAEDGPVRCGDDVFCLGEAIMVFAVEPLVTPEGKGLADVAVRQLDTHGVTIERVEQPFDHVLSVTGTAGEDVIEGRIIASRGWVFLVTGPEADAAALTAILDARIAGSEGSSAT